MKKKLTKILLTAIAIASLLMTPCSDINTTYYEDLIINDSQYYPLENHIEKPHSDIDYYDD